MFRRDFLTAIAAAAAGLAVPRRAVAALPRRAAAALSPSTVVAPAVGRDISELRRLLRQCKCIEISGEFSVNDILRHRTVHRAENDPHGVSLNAEFERMLANAMPTSVSYSAEIETIDVWAVDSYKTEHAITTIEVEWIGGGA
jgi:hypothetical protein